MSIARAPQPITQPIAVGTNEVVAVEVFSDRPPRTPEDITSKTVTVAVLNPGATAVTAAAVYTVSATSASQGQGTITLTGASHTTEGTSTWHLYVNGLLRERYQVEFIAKYS